MERIKNFLRNLMVGRYGLDHLNVFLIYLMFVFSIFAIFTKDARVFSGLRLSSFLLSLYVLFRMMSKKINKRYQENIKFLKATKPIRAKIDLMKLRWRDRKTHKYVACPSCKKVTRVPKGAGKIKIRCKNCGKEFIKRV